MHRCLQLATLATGNTAPNPMVGAVLVHDNQVIGEGYHKQFGGPHAEPDCIGSVKEQHKSLIAGSTLYVSLEPCAHYGKTPPCADLILRHNIQKVVVGCRDPFEEVNGKGIEKLRAGGVEVMVGLLEKECIDLNKYFFTFHTKKRPYIILKWAQTADGFIGSWKHESNNRVLISNETTNRLVHKWRTETASILVGTNTALQDDPSLTARLWQGNNPVRLVVDRNLQLPRSARLLDGSARTIVFNNLKQGAEGNIIYHKPEGNKNLVNEMMDTLFKKQINSLLVEGGAQMLQSFLNLGMWDEARIITNRNMYLHDGVKAPIMHDGKLAAREHYGNDEINYLVHVA